MTNNTIPHLVDRWHDGDEQAAAILFDRYQERLMKLVSRHLNQRLKSRLDPDDLVQSIMKSAFRVTREQDIGCQDETGFWKWLVTVALNKTYKRINRESANKRDVNREISATAIGDQRVLSDPCNEDVVEVADLLAKILDQLSDTEAQILLAKLDGLTQKEIAAQLNVSTKTVQRNSASIRTAAINVLGCDCPRWVFPEHDGALVLEGILNQLVSDWRACEFVDDSFEMQTIGDVLHGFHADSSLLNDIRKEAKRRGSQSHLHPEQEKAYALVYHLAIVLSELHCDQRITTDTDRRLLARTESLLAAPWVPETYKQILAQYVSHLKCRQLVPA